jgi:hypothetical protein
VLPDLLGDCVQVGKGDEPGGAGVVDEHIDPAEMAGCQVDHRLHLVLDRDIGLDR